MMTKRSVLLRMSGVKLQFDHKMVLNSIDLAVLEQERLVIMGLSGSGKSTLLRLVLGLLQPVEGSIFFKDRDIAAISRRELNRVRSRIGMLYQNSALLSSLNVHDNMALPLQELSDKTPAEIERIIDEKLDRVGMQEAKYRMPSELSGGMQKRIGLARALVMDPDLLLFDEPSTGLDPINTSIIRDLIIDMTEKQKVTSIVVTHDLQTAFYVATRMAMLYEGKIIEENTPENFRRSENPMLRQFLSGWTEGPLKEKV